MELKELNQEEQITISGGNPASDGFWFAVGAICKGIAAFCEGASEGGYAYAKCGTR
jgi:hypothetical protein